ncbi:imidazole glycerol phosphate synthase subunit HisF [Halpernia frigidisoli]|uniref:Imidazole glycerol phosphate synthase subunit HisF n=1 Tax=Halpernia frigidisoli TaxID=1125876 RepID=A0A1I3CVE4_9FLAO|nr:imidazole glycerol phosphate synthase subunit HisF [Halpernia frigidisoli]SFH78338.1 cyclase [Halpernia frigidisoli]
MLKKRIIPCLDIKDGRTVKGINFVGLRDAGNPVELAKKYSEQGADELVFLDISATDEKRKTLIHLVEELSIEINIPFTVGGGISTLNDVDLLLKAGADKVSLNSSVVKNPNLIKEISQRFGNQCVVVAVDSKQIEDQDFVFVNGGKIKTELHTLDWVKRAEELGAGEILLTSMDFDGTKQGFDVRLLKQVSEICNLPLIASGGAGKIEDFTEVFTQTNATGALAASIFHFGEIEIPDLKLNLKNNRIAIR